MLTYEERAKFLAQKEFMQENMLMVYESFEKIKTNPMDLNLLMETIAQISQTLNNTVSSYSQLLDCMIEYSRENDGNQK